MKTRRKELTSEEVEQAIEAAKIVWKAIKQAFEIVDEFLSNILSAYKKKKQDKQEWNVVRNITKDNQTTDRISNSGFVYHNRI